MDEEPRTLRKRIADARIRLETDVDLWLSTSDGGTGDPYLVPLSFAWDGTTVLVATPVESATGRNLRARPRTRLALGPTRDVVLIDGTVEMIAIDALPTEEGDAFARTGFDPRTLEGYAYFRITPTRIQAWREANELAGRILMRDGAWLPT
jgi:Pyridoxamine 5'-phosphate oxidase